MIQARDIPESTRVRMANHVLTRLVVALGQDSENIATFRERMFSEMAEEIRTIATRYNLPRDNAAHLVQTLGVISVILFGPEFETRFIEGFPEEAVIRLTECAMFREESDQGISPSQVNGVCQAYVRHAIESLNPEFTVRISRARCRGDSFCEMVIARKGEVAE